MKRPENTEMDRLLRRHARLGGGAVRGAHGSGAHMDADEMSAYAEGALPQAARSRYFAHLADCDACRKLVTELTLAAGAAEEGRARALTGAVTDAPSKSWRERLAAIFAPQVLRYAVPALALFAVVIVAMVAMRARRDGSSVARNEQVTSNAGGDRALSNSAVQPAPAETARGHAGGEAGAPTDDGTQAGTEPAAPAPTPTPLLAEKGPAERDVLPPSQPGAAPATTMAKTEDAKPSAREDDEPTGGRRAQEEQEVAAAPPPPPRPVAQEPAATTPQPSDETSARDAQEQRKTKAAGKDDGTDLSTGTFANTGESDKRGDVGRAEGAAAPSTRSRAPMTRKASPQPGRAQNESAAETRSAGGRSFRRQGGAWVDTDYNPSRPTTNVRRGSEQYRTLVADEPGLRAITDQLGGEVVVVWKTRAYRFY